MYKGSLCFVSTCSDPAELCLLCDTPITVRFQPCEHSVVCEDCARRASKCPHCKVCKVVCLWSYVHVVWDAFTVWMTKKYFGLKAASHNNIIAFPATNVLWLWQCFVSHRLQSKLLSDCSDYMETTFWNTNCIGSLITYISPCICFTVNIVKTFTVFPTVKDQFCPLSK